MNQSIKGDTYIGTKIIQAVKATYGEYSDYKTANIAESKIDKKEEGFMVQYKDGYVAWSPKLQFEEAYRKIQVGDKLFLMLKD